MLNDRQNAAEQFQTRGRRDRGRHKHIILGHRRFVTPLIAWTLQDADSSVATVHVRKQRGATEKLALATRGEAWLVQGR